MKFQTRVIGLCFTLLVFAPAYMSQFAWGQQRNSKQSVTLDPSGPESGHYPTPWLKSSGHEYVSCAAGRERTVYGVHCPTGSCGEGDWADSSPLDFEPFRQGEYIGPSRLEHVPQYLLRVDDVIDVVFRLTREQTQRRYLLGVGDRVRIESVTDAALNREVTVQPDGSVTLPYINDIRAAKKTISAFQTDVERAYRKFYKIPGITITPIQTNVRLEDLRDSITNRFTAGGQSRQARVAADGTIRLPGLRESVPTQGLTLEELQSELNARYAAHFEGIEVTPILVARAPAIVYVAGEVRTPGRYEITKPTSVLGALALAGGQVNGGNLREIVVMRRMDDWRVMATRIDIQGAMLGKRPCPADDLWLRDSDVIIVPKTPLRRADDFIELFFTRGVYGVVPPQFIYTARTVFAQRPN